MIRLRYGAIKSSLFCVALLGLALKGGQDSLATPNSVDLPFVLSTLKEFAAPIAAFCLCGYAFVSLLRTRRVSLSLAAVGYVAVLSAFYIRSVSLESSVWTNLGAFLLLLVGAAGVAADGRDSPVGHAGATWRAGLESFFLAYTLLSLSLFLGGFGGFGARFAGAAYHPNAHGFIAALATTHFMLRLQQAQASRVDLAFRASIFLVSLFLVLASGSRAAMVMVALAFFLTFPVKRAAITAVVVVSSFLVAVNTGFGDVLWTPVERMRDAPLDNRDAVWAVLIRDFLANPLTGVGDLSGVSGNAVLTAFAGLGLLGGGVFAAVVVVSLFHSISLFIERRNAVRAESRADATLFVVIFASAMFEAALFDKFGPAPLIMLVVLSALREKPNVKSHAGGDGYRCQPSAAKEFRMSVGGGQ